MIKNMYSILVVLSIFCLQSTAHALACNFHTTENGARSCGELSTGMEHISDQFVSVCLEVGGEIANDCHGAEFGCLETRNGDSEVFWFINMNGTDEARYELDRAKSDCLGADGSIIEYYK